MTCTDNKVLVNVAPVAAADKVIIPEKIAEDVYECYKEGAAMVHLHVCLLYTSDAADEL